MSFKFNIWRNKHGELMVFLNDCRRKVSVGASTEKGFPAPYGKYTTQGQRKLLEKVPLLLERLEWRDFKWSSPHQEEWVKIPRLGTVYITDTATVCGCAVGSDGAWLVRGDKIADLSQYIQA